MERLWEVLVRFDLSRFSDRVLSFIAIASAIVLFISCFYLVQSQYKVRMLTAEKERVERVRHALLDESSQLALELSRAALPKYVISRANELGYVNADVKNTVMIQVPANQFGRIRLEVRK